MTKTCKVQNRVPMRAPQETFVNGRDMINKGKKQLSLREIIVDTGQANVVDGVAYNDSPGAKCLNLQPGHNLPQGMQASSPIQQEPMIGIVSPIAPRIGKRDHDGDGSTRRTQHPASHQPGENGCPRSRKNREKLLKKVRPCRSIHIHFDQPVFSLNPIKTSAGRYVFDNKPLKYVA